MTQDLLDLTKDKFQTPKVIDNIAVALGGPALLGIVADVMTHGNVLTTPLEANIAVGGFTLSVTLNASVESGVWIANRSRDLAQRLGRHMTQHSNTDSNFIENNRQLSHFALGNDAGQHISVPCPAQLFPQNPSMPQEHLPQTHTTPEA